MGGKRKQPSKVAPDPDAKNAARREKRNNTTVFQCACGKSFPKAHKLNKHQKDDCPKRFKLQHDGIPLPEHYICTPWGIVSCHGDLRTNEPIGHCLLGGCWQIWETDVSALNHRSGQEKTLAKAIAKEVDLTWYPWFHYGVHGNDPNAPPLCLCHDGCHYVVSHVNGEIKDARIQAKDVKKHNTNSVKFHKTRLEEWKVKRDNFCADEKWDWLGKLIGEFIDRESARLRAVVVEQERVWAPNQQAANEEAYFEKRERVDPEFERPIRYSVPRSGKTKPKMESPVASIELPIASSSTTASARTSSDSSHRKTRMKKIKYDFRRYIDPSEDVPFPPITWTPSLPESVVAENEKWGRQFEALIEEHGVNGGWKPLPAHLWNSQ